MSRKRNRRPEDRVVVRHLIPLKDATKILSSGARHLKSIRRWRGYSAEGFENGKCDLCYAFRPLNCVARIHKGMPLPLARFGTQGLLCRDEYEYDDLDELTEAARERYRKIKYALIEKLEEAESRFESEFRKAMTRLRIPLPPLFLHDFRFSLYDNPGQVGNIIFAQTVDKLECTIIAAYENALTQASKPPSTKRYPSALKPFFEAVYHELKHGGSGLDIIDVISDVKTADEWEATLKPYKCRNNDKTLCSYYTTWLHKNHPEAVQVRTTQRPTSGNGQKTTRI